MKTYHQHCCINVAICWVVEKLGENAQLYTINRNKLIRSYVPMEKVEAIKEEQRNVVYFLVAMHARMRKIYPRRFVVYID